jgi:hypothetical protein
MRIRYIATFAETIRTDRVTLAREYLSARDANEREFQTDEARSAYVDVLLALGRFQHRTAFARAHAQFNVRPEAVDATRQDNRLRPIAWSFGEGATFPGFTDDTTWNGFLNVRVPVSAWSYVLAELIDGADGDAETIEGYRRLGTTEGLVCLSHGFTTHEVIPTWASLFPDYAIDTMVPIPSEWSEMSWRHETAPSFGPCVGPMGEAAQIWIDYEQAAMREFPESARFTFSRRDAVGELTVIYAGDDYAEALGHIAIETLACAFAHGLAEQLDPAEWREMRVRNQTIAASLCASHDFLDANMVMLAAWQATCPPAIVGNGDADALDTDLAHVNAAWEVATRYYLTASDEAARFDNWRVTGRDVPSLTAAGHDLATIPPSDSPGRVYSVGLVQAHGTGWIVDVGNTSQCFDHLIDAEAHLWSVFASHECRDA